MVTYHSDTIYTGEGGLRWSWFVHARLPEWRRRMQPLTLRLFTNGSGTIRCARVFTLAGAAEKMSRAKNNG